MKCRWPNDHRSQEVLASCSSKVLRGSPSPHPPIRVPSSYMTLPRTHTLLPSCGYMLQEALILRSLVRSGHRSPVSEEDSAFSARPTLAKHPCVLCLPLTPKKFRLSAPIPKLSRLGLLFLVRPAVRQCYFLCVYTSSAMFVLKHPSVIRMILCTCLQCICF